MLKPNLKKYIADFLKKCRGSNKKPLLVLLGPTASGKTALSLKIAGEFNCEIISADSRQIYKYMDIGTDKVLAPDRKGIPHYLIDIAEPSERFTVADFKRLAEEKIEDILSHRKIPFIVGGTGLYIDVLTKNFSLPPENKKLRAELEAELKKYGKKYLHEKLKKLDPENAAKIHPNNARYVIRAIEIFMATNAAKNDKRAEPKYEILQFGLNWPKEKLFERIELRVDEQLKRGLIEETKHLLGMGYDKALPSMTSFGYKEIIKYLDRELTLLEATELLKKNTRDYAKRQITWFKRDKNIIWLNAQEIF
ncbi:tRNA (adenosine(37)-N6)-dimethylallyltransferase MiaA [Candidatus Peregrinibacteria bacterium]|nr:tRNA (adenosine(37)-N6)-dimethylallyltransferase MiaA [Candidatus Peregrinibacteria bacterium]